MVLPHIGKSVSGPVNPGGRTAEEQKEYEERIARNEAWLEREYERIARGTPTALTSYETPTATQIEAYKEFLPPEPPPPETILEQPLPELNVPQFLPPDILEQLGTDWYSPEQQLKKTGKPETFEEQQFVLDYLSQYGMRPARQTVEKWTKRQDRPFTYDPASTMGQMGFRGLDEYLRAQREGEPFGPWAGKLTPWDAGIVITDEKGNPIMRVMDVNRPEAQKAIREGRYINPITGDLASKYQTGLPGSETFYNRLASVGLMPELGIEEAIKRGTPQMYLGALSDYLASVVRQDWPKREALESQLEALESQIEQFRLDYKNLNKRLTKEIASGNITEIDAQNLSDQTLEQLNEKVAQLRAQPMAQLRAQMEALMTEAKSKQEYARARDMILQGTPLEELPFLKEVSPTIWQLITGAQKQQFETESKAREKEQPLPWMGYPAPEPAPPQDIAAIIAGLNTTPEYRRYLLNNIGFLRQAWQRSGEPDFYTWLLSQQGVK